MSDLGMPRDLVGYGQHPPHPRWPNNARLALQFVINYEEGGENCILDGDPSSEWLLSDIIGATPYANQRHMNMESLYEYGSRSGFWRLHRLFTQKNYLVLCLRWRWHFKKSRRCRSDGRGRLGGRQSWIALDRLPKHAGR